ncbi:hypothetical protein POTOM_045780 [Populus tomentosa]|uniref:E3 ubiquitin-protein ligase RMA n=1 Tax=Populus tomentosa TaxID=118781 RepID=A0A8X7YIB8_POPTO|nr:hypothetical protein POTOM_045780 [Populus tomentosa]
MFLRKDFCIKGLIFDDLLDVLSSNDRSHPSLKSRKSEPSLFLPRSKAAKNSRLEPDTMALDQYMEETVAQNDYNTEVKPSLPNWKSVSERIIDSDDSPSSGFDCNICLDSVHDPVVTLCGHLYCWPCIYKWLHFQSISDENQDQHPQQQCPVCKAEVSQSTIVPLFGRGQTTKPCKGKAPNLGIIIPRRPPGRACGFDSPRSPIATSSPRVTPQIHHRHYYPHQSQRYYSQPGSNSTSPMRSSGGSTLNMPEPEVGMFGEIMYSRVFDVVYTCNYKSKIIQIRLDALLDVKKFYLSRAAIYIWNLSLSESSEPRKESSIFEVRVTIGTKAPNIECQMPALRQVMDVQFSASNPTTDSDAHWLDEHECKIFLSRTKLSSTVSTGID